MQNTLKKFKSTLKNLFEQSPKKITFTNHKFQIKQQNYLLCKALVPSIPEILAVERAVYQDKTPWDDDVFAKEIADDAQSLYLIVRHQDEMVAFIGCNFKYPKKAHITNLAVLPSYQQKGLGTYLLQTIFLIAKKNNCLTVNLEVASSNQKAQNLYEKLNFKQVKIKLNYYDNHETAFLYQRTLTDIKDFKG